MKQEWQRQISTRLGPAFMLVALLPAIVFIDHWALRFEIPGTASYIGMPMTATQHRHDGGENHTQHCHESIATCSDSQIAAGAAVALLAAVVSALLLGGLAHKCRGEFLARPGQESRGPEPRPPRRAIQFA